MIGILSDPDLYERAGKVYGFAVPPDPVTLSQRQVEILEAIAGVLQELDRAIARIKALSEQTLPKRFYDGLSPEEAREQRVAAGHWKCLIGDCEEPIITRWYCREHANQPEPLAR